MNVLKDIVKSLKELHSIGVTHFDLKPENVILVNGRWKLCDFGSVLTKAVKYDRLNRIEQDEFREFVQ